MIGITGFTAGIIIAIIGDALFKNPEVTGFGVIVAFFATMWL